MQNSDLFGINKGHYNCTEHAYLIGWSLLSRTGEASFDVDDSRTLTRRPAIRLQPSRTCK